MKIAYISRTGNVEMFVQRLGLPDIVQINNGSEVIGEDFVLVTYTDGYGELPEELEVFLENNSNHLKGVAASGDRGYGDAYCLAADVVSEMFGVPILAKFEFDGTDEDIEKFLNNLSKL